MKQTENTDPLQNGNILGDCYSSMVGAFSEAEHAALLLSQAL